MRLRLVLLTAFPELYTPRRISDAVLARGGEVSVVRPPPWWSIARSREVNHTGSRPCDASGPVLLTRAGPFQYRSVLHEHGRRVRRGAIAFSPRRSLRIASDQWRTLCELADGALPVPRTLRVVRPADLDRALPQLGPPAWFVKGRRGSQGSHVFRATTRAQAREAGARYFGQGESYLVQEDLGNTGSVRRVLVIGETAVACVRAIPAPGEYRSNVHRGGRFEKETAAERHEELARRAAMRIGLRFAAVDLIGDESPRILEVNASPGLEGIEAATGLDLAGGLAEELLRFAATGG